MKYLNLITRSHMVHLLSATIFTLYSWANRSIE
nr:MAG TPA: hypothetical protein [Caudoviricetes sp.]